MKNQADGRLVIKLPDIRRDVVDRIIERLAPEEIFQRGQLLVKIFRGPEISKSGVVTPTGEPRIDRAAFENIHELAQIVCKFTVQKRAEFGGKVAVEIDPPMSIIGTLMARKQWSHIRPLEGLVNWPVMRSDGTVFAGTGYDIGSRCYAARNVELDLPERVTREHVRLAIAEFDDILCDFPFERPEHKSAWLAALLAVIARPAIDGPVPMVVVDANDRGAGKTLLCDVNGIILTGKELPRFSAPNSEDEWGKSILSIGIEAHPVILLDNVTGSLRSRSLDAILTGTSFKGRLLGENTIRTVPVRTQWLVSSNNATLSTDLIRRSLHCRLVVDEHPERRAGFRHNLPDEVAKPETRKRLLEAAVKILLGYEHAGRPYVKTRPMGSYVAWCKRVQKPIVWAGLADPVVTQDELRESADTEHEQLEVLLEAWYEFFGQESVTMGQALNRVREAASESNRKAMNLQAAFETLSEIPGQTITAARVGYKIRGWREKWLNGKSFSQGTIHSGARKWCVRVKR